MQVRFAKQFQPGIQFMWMPGFLYENVASRRGFSPDGRRELGASLIPAKNL